MHLIVGTTIQCEWDGILSLLEDVGCTIADQQLFEKWCLTALKNESSELDGDLKTMAGELLAKTPSPAIFPVYNPQYLSVLQRWTNELQDGYTLFIYTRPEEVVMKAMEQHRDPDELLAQWRESAEQVLKSHRQNTNKSLLLNAQSIMDDPEAFLQACKELCGLNFNLQDLMRDRNVSSYEIHKLLATEFVSQTPELQSFLNELTENSLSLEASDTSSTINYAKAYRDFERLKIQKTLERLKNFERENELLILHLHQAQEELDKYYHGEAKPENTSSQLEKSHLEEIEKLSKEIRGLRQSTSWKITAPLRVFIESLRKILRKASSK